VEGQSKGDETALSLFGTVPRKSDRAELLAARVRPFLQKALKTPRIALSRFWIDEPLHVRSPAKSTDAELAARRH